jgi:lysine 2,3-aminomutase
MALRFEPSPKPEGINSEDWQDWRWHLRRRLAGVEDFAACFDLSETEKDALARSARLFKVQATPYYAAIAKRNEPRDPIRRMILPAMEELSGSGQQIPDPLGERPHSPVERLVHRYPDRVLFLVTDTCSVYCRFCLRKYFTGHDEAFIAGAEYEAAIAYIRANPGIREVILSGGDPLTLSDQRVLKVAADLRAIAHVEIIRLATRMPVVCPMRITKELVSGLKAFHPVMIMTHFNHPRELTAEAAAALGLLVDNGFPVFNQMVLLRGVNNHPAVVHALSRRLLFLRVKPYYMFQCDPSEGTEHFRTSIEESMSIQRELWGRMSGLAMPNLSLDIPGGGGKVGVVPDFLIEKGEGRHRFRGWDGKEADYLAPGGPAVLPFDYEAYLPEWERLRAQNYGARK